MGGVTRILTISYLRPVPIGTTIRVHAQVVQHGRTMALMRGKMTSVDGKKVFATAEHHKVNVPMNPKHVNPEVDEALRQVEAQVGWPLLEKAAPALKAKL